MSNEGDQVRENIRAYLQHIADIDIGTVLTPQGREIVGFCAAWVQNRLDEEWLADKVVPLAGAKEAEDTVEAIRADLEEERRYRDRAEVLLEGVRREAKLWQDYAEGVEDSDKSMRRIHALIIAPDLLHPTGRCSCGGEGRCNWCKANPDPYQADGPESSDDLEPDVEGVMEALQDTQAYIASCLGADAKLQAVRNEIAAWEGATVAQTASCQAEHAAKHLDRIRSLLKTPSAERGQWRSPS